MAQVGPSTPHVQKRAHPTKGIGWGFAFKGKFYWFGVDAQSSCEAIVANCENHPGKFEDTILPGIEGLPLSVCQVIAVSTKTIPAAKKKSEANPFTPGISIDLVNMDWALLRVQKRILLGLMSGSSHVDLALEGVTTLIDTIQDQAVEKLGEDVVFCDVTEMPSDLLEGNPSPEEIKALTTDWN